MTVPNQHFHLHHIGLVVPSLEAGHAILGALGFDVGAPTFADPIQKVTVQFIDAGGDVSIELIAPGNGDSPVSRFVAERGAGLHHLCYEVPDIDAACGYLRNQRSVMTCAPVPAVAFGGRRISFHYWQKQLIELLEAERPTE
jgi:methylmalonyl-CoA/ethylmalonyl-CoA epimerase